MRNQEELQLEKMLEVLKGIGFSSEQLLESEEYLQSSILTSEDKSQVKISGLKKQYLSELPEEQKQRIHKVFNDFLVRRHLREAKGLFQILYEIGGATITKVFPVSHIKYNIINHDFTKQLESYQIITVYANLASNEEYLMKKEAVTNILKLSGGEEAPIIKAIDTWYNNYINGKLMLYCAYFSLMLKKLSNEEGVLADKKEIEKLAPEYYEYFSDFESTILRNVTVLLSVSEQEHNTILGYLGQGKTEKDVEAEVFEVFKTHRPDRFMQKLLIGCGSAILPHSPKLKKLVKLCCYSELDETLDAIYGFLRPVLREKFAKSCIEEYGLDVTKYILWCGKTGFEEGLLEEAKVHTAQYKEALKIASLESYPHMAKVFKNSAPVDYKEYILSNITNLQDRITEEILPAGKAKQAVQLYLKGETKVNTLYPFALDLGNEKFYQYQVGQHLKTYVELTGEDSYYKRCICYMVFVVSGYFYHNMFNIINGKDKTDLRRLFSIWEEEGLALSYQLQGTEVIHDDAYSNEVRETIINDVIPIFFDYLEKKEMETLAAFASAGAVGRSIGVRTLFLKPQVYKNQLLDYFSDTSKLVRDNLIELVAKEVSFEEEVLHKLNSKKEAEREKALHILNKWDKDYTEILTKALEK